MAHVRLRSALWIPGPDNCHIQALSLFRALCLSPATLFVTYHYRAAARNETVLYKIHDKVLAMVVIFFCLNSGLCGPPWLPKLFHF